MTTSEIIEKSRKEMKDYCSQYNIAQVGKTWSEFEEIIFKQFVEVNKHLAEKDK